MTPTESAAMTTDQLRDWCAEDDGWRIFTMPNGTKLYLAPGKPDCNVECPYPPTRDGAAAALPEGWWWSRYETPAEGVKWCAGPRNGFASVYVYDTGDEIGDRYRLAVPCRLAEREAKG